MTEPPDFATALWKELENHAHGWKTTIDGKTTSLIVDFDQLKAAIAGVIRAEQARQFCPGGEDMTLTVRYDDD